MERWATFDCYGTLVDWNGGIRRELARIFGEEEADAKLAAYHELEPVIEDEEPALAYREVMARVLERLGAPAEERGALGDSLPSWPVFPEVPRRARAGAGARLESSASSPTPTATSSTPRWRRSASHSTRRSSPREIGSYKPAHGHWQAFEKDVGRLPDVHVAASLFHDVAPTAELGIPCFWINRLGEEHERLRAGARIADSRIPRGGPG